MQALQMLLGDGIVDEIVGQLKSGKEADVWLVRHNDEIVAAKIYKEREFRSFKNNAEYKEGRQVRNSRTQRAMNSGSRFGQKAAEDAWKASEADTLAKLHAAGARVPKPVLFYEGVLLMEVVIDAEGRVAPRLVDAHVSRESAKGLYETVRAQVVKMLCADLIHGDLSEFNVLLAHDGPVVIDFPQVVAAAQNSRAEHFFKRDLENVRRFFATIDPTLNNKGDADEIWRAYVRRDLSSDFVPSGRAPPPPPQHQQRGNQRPAGGQRPPNRGNPSSRGPEVSFRGAGAAPSPAEARGQRTPDVGRGGGGRGPGQPPGPARSEGGKNQVGRAPAKAAASPENRGEGGRRGGGPPNQSHGGRSPPSNERQPGGGHRRRRRRYF